MYGEEPHKISVFNFMKEIVHKQSCRTQQYEHLISPRLTGEEFTFLRTWISRIMFNLFCIVTMQMAEIGI